jgi:histone-lysine N-methyltransferase SETD1
MSQSHAQVHPQISEGGTSPRSLKRKRHLDSSTRSHNMTTNGAPGSHYISPNSDDMGDALRGSTSSLGSVPPSNLHHNNSAFSHNHKASGVNGLTPLTSHSDSSPRKVSTPQYSHMASADPPGTSAASHMPTSNFAPQRERAPRPQMLPPPGKVKGYRAVWDPELDNKLSKEERKRATFKKKDFGAEVRTCPMILLSLKHIT